MIRIFGISFLIISIASFPFGIWSPMVTSSKFIVSRHTFSLLTSLQDLQRANEYPLFILILLFCILFPIVKLLILSKFWFHPNAAGGDKTLKAIASVGKWSMIDVFMCANLFVILKLGYTVQITIHNGLYYFALTVITSMLSSELAVHYAKRRNPEG